MEIDLGWELSRMDVDNSHVSGCTKKTVAEFNKMKMIIVLDRIFILFRYISNIQFVMHRIIDTMSETKKVTID